MTILNGVHSNSIASVLILGDNRVSTSIINAISDSNLKVHQAVHAHSEPSSGERVTIHRTDLSAPSLTDIFSSVKPSLIISTVAGGSFETQKCILDCAVSAGVPHFIPAEFGHDSLNEKIQARLPPLLEKARVIEYARNLSAKGSISWVAAATGVTLDQGLHSGNLGFDFEWQSATLHGGGQERFAASSQAWIGHVVSGVIEHFDELKNRYLYASGLITSANDIVACLEQLTDKEWQAGRAEVDECVREAENRMARGFPDAGMFLMERSVMYDERLDAAGPFMSNDAKTELGLKGEKLEEVIKAALHQHKHHGKGGCGCD